MRMKWRTRLALCLAIITMLLPGLSFFVPQYASASYYFERGSGTESDPYIVTTPEHLDNVRLFPNAYFLQAEDVDLSDWPDDWMPICSSSNPFAGEYNGGGHIISNLSIVGEDLVNFGLFGRIGEGGAVKNLRLTNFNIDVWFTAGTLVGENLGTIEHCHARGGSVTCHGPNAGGLAGRNIGLIKFCSADVQVSGREIAGGLVGVMDIREESRIENSYALGKVDTIEYGAGGLVGILSRGIISACFAQGAVSGNDSVGGLAGASYAEIANSFATGKVTANITGGGLIGTSNSAVTNCYSIGSVSTSEICGGLIGRHTGGIITSCYYDSETSGQTDEGKGIPKTTDEMYDSPSPNIFHNWSSVYWNFNVPNQYPMLNSLWGALKVTILPPEAVNAGAKWSIDGGHSWLDSNTEHYVAPGRYSVIFKAIPGWDVPSGKTQKYVDLWQNVTTTRNYSRKLYTIAATATPENSGTVSGAGTYYYGDTVILSAVSAPGFQFFHWLENKTIVSNSEKLELTVFEDHNLVAVFKPREYSISVSVIPSEGGSVTGAGTYNHGSNVTLKATPNQGYRFVNWSEAGSEVSSEAVYTFSASADRVLTANFEPIGVERIAGSNRYGTAIEISKRGWPQGAGTVILARSDDYADALAGVPLAYQLNAPILLTRTNALTSSTKEEIIRLGTNRVIILGGTGAVSDAVFQELVAMGLNVERISGSGRYDTAAEIAREMAKGGPIDTAFIAVGTNFADALSSSSYAAKAGCPILLVQTTRIPAATETVLSELGITKTNVIGGDGVINGTVFSLLPGAERIAGSNRYSTAIALAEKFLPAATKQVYIATGLDFPDAIAGGVLAAKYNSGVLLVRGDLSAPNQTVQDFLLTKGIVSAGIFGGTGAVTAELEQWFRDNLN